VGARQTFVLDKEKKGSGRAPDGWTKRGGGPGVNHRGAGESRDGGNFRGPGKGTFENLRVHSGQGGPFATKTKPGERSPVTAPHPPATVLGGPGQWVTGGGGWRQNVGRGGPGPAGPKKPRPRWGFGHPRGPRGRNRDRAENPQPREGPHHGPTPGGRARGGIPPQGRNRFGVLREDGRGSGRADQRASDGQAVGPGGTGVINPVGGKGSTGAWGGPPKLGRITEGGLQVRGPKGAVNPLALLRDRTPESMGGRRWARRTDEQMSLGWPPGRDPKGARIFQADFAGGRVAGRKGIGGGRGKGGLAE